MKTFKVIELVYSADMRMFYYTHKMLVFKDFNAFEYYTRTMQKRCKNECLRANYWVNRKDTLVKILFISENGLYCTQ